MLPWKIYEHYGDKRILEEAYPAMKRYVDFLTRTTRYAENDYDYMIYWPTMLGDWLEVGSGGTANRTPRALTCTQAFFSCAKTVSNAARLLGMQDDEAKYAEIAGKILEAFNEEYLDAATGLYAIDSQSAQAMSLVLQMAPNGIEKKELDQKIFDQLVKNVEETRGGHLSTGIVGTYFLYRALGLMGRADLAFQVITAKDYPGFEHMLTRVDETMPLRSTTLWEDWKGVSSLAHPVQGSVVSFFYEYLAGIHSVITGFKRFIVSPCIIDGLSWVDAKLETSYGTISSRWSIESGKKSFTIHVPPNTTAVIQLPCDDPALVLENNASIIGRDDLVVRENVDGHFIIDAGSGTYVFSVS